MFSSAAASIATKFTMLIASAATTASAADPVSIVALICCCQLLFAASVYALLTRKQEPTVVHVHMSSAQQPVTEVQHQEPVKEVQPQEPLAPIRIPKQTHPHKRLQDYLQDGQRVRHKNKTGNLYGQYNATSDRIISEDGTALRTLSGFAVHHLQSINPGKTHTADGWARCEVDVAGTWVQANTLQKI
jgi:hypothetical protein